MNFRDVPSVRMSMGSSRVMFVLMGMMIVLMVSNVGRFR